VRDARSEVEAACLRYLARREYSAAELRWKLAAKGFPDTVITQVLSDLAQKGFQSDSRFAENYARSRAEKGYGAYRIQQELKQRGIENEEQSVVGEWDWDVLIEKVHAKKYGDSMPTSLAERASRENFLRRRGFGSDQIRQLFRRLEQGADI
jgi:regulatory protein